MKIIIASHHPFALWNAPEWLAVRLRADFHNHEFVQLPGYESLATAIPDAEVLISWTIRPDQFALTKKLRWIHSPAAAVHQLMFPELVASSVIVTNAREVHAPVVAEHIIALMFAMAKRLPTAMRMQQTATWGQQAIFEMNPTVREINGSTVCLIGMGSIGREFTTRARALGMKVLAVREHPERGSEGADAVFGPAQLAQALPRADFVVLAAPLTTTTRSIINAESLAHMRSDAYLINVGRGPLIDDAALIAALRAQKIAGGALDTFVTEPLPAESPYWSLENVLITPHIAAVTEKLWERQYQLIADNFRRYLSGEPMRGMVDKTRGY